MSIRSDRVWLKPGKPRCEPGKRCTMRARCARVQAPINKGDPVEDFTTGDNVRDQVGGTALCPGYIDVHAAFVEKQDLRPIKPAPKGIA